MRISEWSSDLCSSVLGGRLDRGVGGGGVGGRGLLCLFLVTGNGAQIGKRLTIVGHYLPTLFLRFMLAISSTSGFCATCGCRSEEHTSELQSLMRISYAVFCLKKKRHEDINNQTEYSSTCNLEIVNRKRQDV